MRHESCSAAKGNTQGRHYTPKSPPQTPQLLDPTHTTSRQIAKIAPQLLKLG
jgi:hypothetical protein